MVKIAVEKKAAELLSVEQFLKASVSPFMEAYAISSGNPVPKDNFIDVLD